MQTPCFLAFVVLTRAHHLSIDAVFVGCILLQSFMRNLALGKLQGPFAFDVRGDPVELTPLSMPTLADSLTKTDVILLWLRCMGSHT